MVYYAFPAFVRRFVLTDLVVLHFAPYYYEIQVVTTPREGASVIGTG